MSRRVALVTMGLFATALALPTPASEPDYAERLPRSAPQEPAEALRSFHALPGFQVELVAAEPDVADPVAVDFDADGRIYVVEMCGYSEQRDESLGRIRLLEDRDGDGRAETSRVFLDGLAWPTAVLCSGGGVFIGDAPDILFARDTNGDGRADERRVVFTGFLHDNVQGLLNSFRWGLDGRIHVSTSSCGARLRRADRPDDPPLELRGRDFAFDPRRLAVEATTGGGQHGMCFDEVGRKFVCSNSDHIQLVMCEDRYLARNPRLAVPAARMSIAADGPQAEVFRTSPIEPWRVLRTELRVAGQATGPIEGGGRAAGYFTSATGLTIYEGDAWPSEYRGQAIVGDVGSNLVHRKRLEPHGVELLARRIDEGREFLTSDDIWFRPAQFANAPDGTLYVLDVYREVIEHPDSLPPEIKRHLDLTSGRDRGRIYRITSQGAKQHAVPRLSKYATTQLVELLAHPNQWHRSTAARLLTERRDPASVELLNRMAEKSPENRGRLHALRLLAQFDALTDERLLPRLSDPDPQVRRHAVQLAERGGAPSSLVASNPVTGKLLELAADPDMLVRYQVAFSLGEFDHPGVPAALAQLIRSDGSERWFELAIQSSWAGKTEAVCESLLADSAWALSPVGWPWIGRLAEEHVAAHHRLPANVQKLLEVQALPVESQLRIGSWFVGAVQRQIEHGKPQHDAFAEIGLDDDKLEARVSEWFHVAHTTATDRSAPTALRIDALQLLRLDDSAGAIEAPKACLAADQAPEIQLAAVATLAARSESVAHEALVDAWAHSSPSVRRSVAEALLVRPSAIEKLLDGVFDERILPSGLAVEHRQRLLQHPNEDVRRRAEKLLGADLSGPRQAVVESYRGSLAGDGDMQRGRAAFRQHCAACHRLEGVGREIGAQLVAFRAKGPEALLLAILDPNREVNPQYVNYSLTTRDGRLLTGLIAGESAGSLTLTRGEGAADTVLRDQIESLESTGRSLMPEGFEQQLDQQAMADLLAYLRDVR